MGGGGRIGLLLAGPFVGHDQLLQLHENAGDGYARPFSASAGGRHRPLIAHALKQDHRLLLPALTFQYIADAIKNDNGLRTDDG